MSRLNFVDAEFSAEIHAFYRGSKKAIIFCNMYMYFNHIMPYGQLSKNFQRKIVIIFLSIKLNTCFGYSKEPSQQNHLIETVLLSNHNICFG